MQGRRIQSIIVAFILVISVVFLLGCSDATAQPLTPSNSQYPADIIGRVTITSAVSELDVRGNKQETKPISPDRNWWIVETTIKNKNYQKPVTAIWDSSMPIYSGGGEVWVLTQNGKIWSGMNFAPSQTTIPTGQTGKLWLAFPSKVDFKPSNYQICYQGEKPFSYGTLVTGDTVSVFDWDLKKVTETQKPTMKPITIPSGTYVGTLQAFTISLTFDGDTLEYYDAYNGKQVFKYTVSKDGSTMTTTNVVTGVTSTGAFKYVKEYNLVVIYTDSGTPVQCYKK